MMPITCKSEIHNILVDLHIHFHSSLQTNTISAAVIVRFFVTTQTQIFTTCILCQIKGMNLRNMNICDVIVRHLDGSGELTPSVPW